MHMVLVCGPSLPVESVRAPSGVEVRGYIPRLYEMHASCDVAVVQCGASSTTELSALRKPFICFPIEGHFEQEAVASRLARYGAGRRMSLKGATPVSLAEAIYQEYRRPVIYAPMPVDGAVKAAAHILRALGG
jgi:UDP:flavonoid glycosyltransferase YjiC (YdhE family)